jgi:cobalt-zinc-cadmium efflux system membrane fusion protein
MTVIPEQTQKASRSEAQSRAQYTPPPKPRKGFGVGKLVVLVLAVVLLVAYISTRGVEQSKAEASQGMATARGYLTAASRKVAAWVVGGESKITAPTEVKPRPPWTGYVELSEDEAKSIGLQVVTVQPQTEPTRLELTGRTDYDPNSLTKIRPRFDTLVRKVYPEIGQRVKAGDPLVDLFSIDLAAAKNDFQSAYVQWRHDQRLLESRRKLLTQGGVAQQLVVDSQNDEEKSRLAFETARGKLRILGVPDNEILPLLQLVGDEPVKPDPKTIDERAQMTQVSPVDGVVITKDVARGNLYDNNDILMTIAPLDHLFVWANVYEKDQAKVFVGQDMDIEFPYLNQVITTKLQYMSTAVSKDTRAIRIRTSVPNVNGKLVADMRVRASVRIPPVKGQTVIPRLAMVVMTGGEFVFVRKTNSQSSGVERFERRQIIAAQERSDQVIVASGLTPGEEVAANGSLNLSQLFEDRQIVETGMPVK